MAVLDPAAEAAGTAAADATTPAAAQNGKASRARSSRKASAAGCTGDAAGSACRRCRRADGSSTAKPQRPKEREAGQSISTAKPPHQKDTLLFSREPSPLPSRVTAINLLHQKAPRKRSAATDVLVRHGPYFDTSSASLKDLLWRLKTLRLLQQHLTCITGCHSRVETTAEVGVVELVIENVTVCHLASPVDVIHTLQQLENQPGAFLRSVMMVASQSTAKGKLLRSLPGRTLSEGAAGDVARALSLSSSSSSPSHSSSPTSSSLSSFSSSSHMPSSLSESSLSAALMVRNAVAEVAGQKAVRDAMKHVCTFYVAAYLW